MKKLVLVSFLVIACTLHLSASQFVVVKFGTERSVALAKIAEVLGLPNATEEDAVIYFDKRINGYDFAKVVFGFEPKGKGNYLNEARFFILAPTRKKAVEQRDSLAHVLSERHSVTYDFEENGNKFYKGGVAPSGIGFLFTVYTQKRQGQWTTELRYGAFHKLK